jgi:N-acetylglucosamine-6-sulfatase
VQRAANKMSAGRRLAGALCFAVLAALAALVASGDREKAAAAKGGGDKPNIVVITSDDQTLSSFRPDVMPKTFKHLVADGTTFENFIASDPNCCPSRATFITGQYAHNTRVFANNPGYENLRDHKNTLPVWLQEAGYRTALVGKYLNKYGQAVKDESKPAPGWDEWHAALEPRGYYGYDLKVNGKTVHYGRGERDYLTRVLTRRAVKIVNKGVRKDDPLFLNFTPFAPHVGPGDDDGRCRGAAVPDPRDYDRFEDVGAPRPPSFNEEDIEDKPTFVRRLPPLTERDDEALDRQYSCALAALAGVDRGIGKIFKAFKKKGELDNTVFIFWSDNGTQFGEHRLRKKQQPYQESVQVPLVIRAPGGTGGETVSATSANIDLAPADRSATAG